MFVWVNTHIGFFVGLFVLGFFLIDKLLVKNLLITILSVITTFFNPFSFKVYLEIINHFTSPLNKMIAEWTTPTSIEIVFCTLLTATAFFLIFKNQQKRLFSFFFFFSFVFFR